MKLLLNRCSNKAQSTQIKLKKSQNPFDTFGFDIFYHLRINKKGEATTISNLTQFPFDYFENGMCERTPSFKHPSYFFSHIGLGSKIDDPVYQEVNRYTAKKFGFSEMLYFFETQNEETNVFGFIQVKTSLQFIITL